MKTVKVNGVDFSIRKITGKEYDALMTEKFVFSSNGSFKINHEIINPIYLSLVKSSSDEIFNKIISVSQKMDYFEKDFGLRKKLINEIKKYVNELSSESDVEKN